MRKKCFRKRLEEYLKRSWFWNISLKLVFKNFILKLCLSIVKMFDSLRMVPGRGMSLCIGIIDGYHVCINMEHVCYGRTGIAFVWSRNWLVHLYSNTFFISSFPFRLHWSFNWILLKNEKLFTLFPRNSSCIHQTGSHFTCILLHLYIVSDFFL